MDYSYYETILILDKEMNNMDTIHKELDSRIRESFLCEQSASELRHLQSAVPKYRFYARPYQKNKTLCLVRSRLPLNLQGERKMDFQFSSKGEDFKFNSFICLNKKIGNKSFFDSRDTVIKKTILPRLKSVGLDDINSLKIGEYERIDIIKNSMEKFFLMGTMIAVEAIASKELAYKIYTEGVGPKSVYGFGLVLKV